MNKNDEHKHVYGKPALSKPAFSKTKIILALISGLLLVQGTAMADDRGGKARGHRPEHVSAERGHKHGTDRHHERSRGHEKRHGDRGRGRHVYRHDDRHHHNHVYSTRVLRPYHHAHRPVYYDPRISLGVHLGHFDIYFED